MQPQSSLQIVLNCEVFFTLLHVNINRLFEYDQRCRIAPTSEFQIKSACGSCWRLSQSRIFYSTLEIPRVNDARVGCKYRSILTVILRDIVACLDCATLPPRIWRRLQTLSTRLSSLWHVLAYA